MYWGTILSSTALFERTLRFLFIKKQTEKKNNNKLKINELIKGHWLVRQEQYLKRWLLFPNDYLCKSHLVNILNTCYAFVKGRHKDNWCYLWFLLPVCVQSAVSHKNENTTSKELLGLPHLPGVWWKSLGWRVWWEGFISRCGDRVTYSASFCLGIARDHVHSKGTCV